MLNIALVLEQTKCPNKWRWWQK